MFLEPAALLKATSTQTQNAKCDDSTLPREENALLREVNEEDPEVLTADGNGWARI